MFIQEQYLELARKIHQENPVVDAHFDLAAEVYERRLTGESGVVEQRYLPHFQEAGLNILVSSIYLTNRDLPELGLRKALGQITALKEDIEPVGDRIRVTKSRAELDENLAAGRISVLLSLEGLDPLGNDLSLLRTFYDLGVRGAGLTWSRRNAFATGCCTALRCEKHNGLIGEGEENLSVKKGSPPLLQPLSRSFPRFLTGGGAARREFRWMRECFYG